MKDTMELYNKKLVDEAAKSRIIKRMATGESESVFWQLGRTFIWLVKTYSKPNEPINSALLDGLINSTIFGGWERFTEPYFYQYLATDAEFGSVQPRLPEGDDHSVNLIAIAFQELEGLLYSTKVNTWVAACEQWLQICNFNWIRKAAENDPHNYYGIPQDDEEIMRWIPKWRVNMFYEYDC